MYLLCTYFTVYFLEVTSRVKQDYVLSFKEQVDIHGKRTAALRALPSLDDSKFLRMWDVSLHIVIRNIWNLLVL